MHDSLTLAHLKKWVETEMEETVQVAFLLSCGYKSAEIRQTLGLEVMEYAMCVKRIERVTMDWMK